MCQKARLCGKVPSIGHTPLNQSHIHRENTAHMSSKYTGILSHLVTILVHQVIPPHPPLPLFLSLPVLVPLSMTSQDCYWLKSSNYGKARDIYYGSNTEVVTFACNTRGNLRARDVIRRPTIAHV